MKIEAFLANASHIKELYVDGKGHWSSTPLKGYDLKSREEILGEAPARKAEPVNKEEKGAEEKSPSKNVVQTKSKHKK